MTSARTSDLRPLSPEEQERLLSALRSESDRIMLRLLLETGRPLDDLRGARVTALDRDRSVLRLKSEDLEESGAEVDEVSLSPELSEAVGDYLERNPGKTHIFGGRCGRPVGPKWVRCTLLPAAIRSGIEDPRADKDHR